VKNIFRILVCPLDWGIGHAARMVTVIKHLLDTNYEVIIAADGMPLAFLKGYFPDLDFISLPGYKVSYPSGQNMALKIVRQAPGILWQSRREHHRLEKIITDHKIDIVVSDNRFGLWSKKAYSVYVTHQIFIKAPESLKWTEPLLHHFHKWFIRKYNECWVPDLPGTNNLSGDLAHKHPLPPNAYFIGALSRFQKDALTTSDTEKGLRPDVLVMLSGPEPQRTILENIVINELSQHNDLNIVILRGLPGKQNLHTQFQGVTVFNHLQDEEMRELIISAGVIICRSGYSTIMDLAMLGKSAVLVPTPGQTEQEYLAGYLTEKGWFLRLTQNEFSISEALELAKKMPGSIDTENNDLLLETRISGLSSQA